MESYLLPDLSFVSELFVLLFFAAVPDLVFPLLLRVCEGVLAAGLDCLPEEGF